MKIDLFTSNQHLKITLSIIYSFCFLNLKSQVYPSFGSEINVTIIGLSFDAMEPFISADGTILFFNNLNDGVDTKLFYATRVNDTTFNFIGEVVGANQIANPQLDAVADMDENNQFYWTSTRNYPAELDNLFYGTYANGIISDSGRVRGNFNLNTPGWLVMDHGISKDGQYLYYNNARFDDVNCQGICETSIGVAGKINDSTFNTISNSTWILQNINNPNYIYYAPCISSDNLEFYYTRYLAGTITLATTFEICVAIRNSPSDSFSAPQVLFSDLITNLIEAPTLTQNKINMYYHKKGTSSHDIKLRHRLSSIGFKDNKENQAELLVYPNPMNNEVIISYRRDINQKFTLNLLDNTGRVIRFYDSLNEGHLTLSRDNLSKGIYYIQVCSNSQVLATRKLIIQ